MAVAIRLLLGTAALAITRAAPEPTFRTWNEWYAIVPDNTMRIEVGDIPNDVIDRWCARVFNVHFFNASTCEKMRGWVLQELHEKERSSHLAARAESNIAEIDRFGDDASVAGDSNSRDEVEWRPRDDGRLMTKPTSLAFERGVNAPNDYQFCLRPATIQLPDSDLSGAPGPRRFGGHHATEMARSERPESFLAAGSIFTNDSSLLLPTNVRSLPLLCPCGHPAQQTR
jgi:hypothetical protein